MVSMGRDQQQSPSHTYRSNMINGDVESIVSGRRTNHVPTRAAGDESVLILQGFSLIISRNVGVPTSSGNDSLTVIGLENCNISGPSVLDIRRMFHFPYNFCSKLLHSDKHLLSYTRDTCKKANRYLREVSSIVVRF
jgi:hypothetical protein